MNELMIPISIAIIAAFALGYFAGFKKGKKGVEGTAK